MASKTLSQPITTNRQVVTNDNQQAEYDLQQSMVALQQQEMMEQEAYLTGNMAGVYDTYADTQNLQQEAVDESQLPDVDPTVTAQQEAASNNQTYSNAFAKLFGTLANVFGKDSQIGSKLNEIAQQLEGTYAQDAYEVQQEALTNLDSKFADGQSVSDSQQTEQTKEDVYVPTAEEQNIRDEQLRVSNSNMEKSASMAVEDDDFLKMADSTKDRNFTHMTAGLRTMELRLSEQAMGTLCAVDSGAKEKSEVSNSYMTMARGIKAYNDTALAEIEVKYQDEPEKLETAKQGLSNMMSRAGTQMYGIIGTANNQYDFLSEQDKAELNAMQLYGVNQTYSEYVTAQQLEPAKEDMSMYADAENQQVAGNTEKSVSTVNTVNKNYMGVESRTAMQRENAQVGVVTHQDRGAMAEAKFATVLRNEAQAQQQSLTAGLER